MAESSAPWAGIVTGDAGPYSDELWADIWRKLFVVDRTTQGVIRGYANELIVAGATSPVSVATGAGIVDGKFYESDTPVSVVIPTPAGATRFDRITLRKSWSAQTVRVTRIAGTEGGGVPALVQSDGVTWDIPLASIEAKITGTTTVTDLRKYILTPLISTLATAVGQIPYVSAANQLSMLALGSALHGLRVNAAGTGLEYGAVPTLAAIRVYTASDTWAKPAGLYGIVVKVVAGGAGGGGAQTAAAQAAAGGGGAAGGYSEKLILAAALGATETVTVGAGGVGGSTAGGNGGTGGTSSFGAHLQATGGGGGNGMTGGTAIQSVGAGLGGVGSGGTINTVGQGGGVGLRGSGTVAISGIGGSSALGGGGKGNTESNAGVAGGAYGGGGSGAAAGNDFDLAGGAGAAGVVIVYEYV